MVNCYDFSLCNRTGSCAVGGKGGGRGGFMCHFKKGEEKNNSGGGGGFNERALMDSQSALVEVGVA